MREYRGKTWDNKEWVYGSLIVESLLYGSEFHIMVLSGQDWEDPKDKDKKIKVRFPTVSQSIGLADKNKKEIYEKDIIKKYISKPFDYDGFGVFVVVYEAPAYVLKPIYYSQSLQSYFGEGKIFGMGNTDICVSNLINMEIIGNTTDNPEMLKVDIIMENKGQIKRNFS